MCRTTTYHKIPHQSCRHNSLKSQLKSAGTHSPELLLNSSSGRDETMTNSTVKTVSLQEDIKETCLLVHFYLYYSYSYILKLLQQTLHNLSEVTRVMSALPHCYTPYFLRMYKKYIASNFRLKKHTWKQSKYLFHI